MSAERIAAWSGARNILVVRLDNLGDVLMSTPAMRAVKQSSPDMRVTLLASPAGAAVARHVPLIDDTVVYEAPWVKGPVHDSRADLQLIAALRERHFDAAVIFTVCTQSALPAALLCRLADIPLRLAHCRENPYELLTDWVIDPDICHDGMRHEVQRQFDLVGVVGMHAADQRLIFEYAANDIAGMQRKLIAAGGNPAKPYVVMHPGASAASRRWPAERFGQTAQLLQRDSGCRVVFVGGRDDTELVRQATEALDEAVVSLAGQLSLGELAALIAGARATVCNNSAPAHIAAALGTPVVVLYALTNPQHTPWRVDSRVLNHPVPCRNCLKSTCPQVHHACLLEVDAPTVVDAVLNVMRAASGTRPPLRIEPHDRAAPLRAGA